MVIDLSLNNETLYDGCEIETVAGRKNLKTQMQDAVNIVGENMTKILVQTTDREEVTLTGPMAVFSYLVVFHMVVHAFKKVYYEDGRGGRALIAAHG